MALQVASREVQSSKEIEAILCAGFLLSHVKVVCLFAIRRNNWREAEMPAVVYERLSCETLIVSGYWATDLLATCSYQWRPDWAHQEQYRRQSKHEIRKNNAASRDHPYAELIKHFLRIAMTANISDKSSRWQATTDSSSSPSPTNFMCFTRAPGTWAKAFSIVSTLMSRILGSP